MKPFWLLDFVLWWVGPLVGALDWKPMLSQSSIVSLDNSKAADTPLYTSSFSLEQTHPDYSGSDTNSFASAFDNKELLLKQQSLFNKKILNMKTTLYETALQSSSINFEDAEFGYKPLEYSTDQCAVKKYAFNNDGVVQYNNKMPELRQFTICFWMRFTNHSGDHVILTYSAKDDSRDFQFWVANSNSSSFISMAIKGQQMYRLNYPLRMKQWHHTCTSWNGKTGEWQVWLKAERIGRGFHNSLVGHKIPGGGKLFSGGTSVTGIITEGLHFEVTLVQIYRVALSAGKAHRDHKHHHVHHFDHEGRVIQTTTRAPPTINRPLPIHNLLASGQIPTRVRLNLAQPVQNPLQSTTPTNRFTQDQQSNSLTIQSNFVNGQYNSASRLLAQQLIGLRHNFIQQQLQQQQPQQQPPQQPQQQPQFFFTPREPSHSQNVQFIDETEARIQFKRHIDSQQNAEEKTLKKRSLPSTDGDEKNIKKRGLVLMEDGSLFDDPLLSGTNDFKFNGLAEFGVQQFKNDINQRPNVGGGGEDIEDEIAEHDREAAEDEVKAVMALCSLCEIEPFEGAIVFAWKDAHEQVDNALKGYSVGGCGEF